MKNQNIHVAYLCSLAVNWFFAAYIWEIAWTSRLNVFHRNYEDVLDFFMHYWSIWLSVFVVSCVSSLFCRFVFLKLPLAIFPVIFTVVTLLIYGWI